MPLHISSEDELVAPVLAGLRGKSRLVIAVAGIPGAGKSTVTERLTRTLGRLGVAARVLPQDGFHYTRAQLAAFPEPAEAFRRRGAPFTFDAPAFVARARALLAGGDVRAPSFDHSKKDPVDDDIVIGSDVRVVFLEGNYVGLADEPWCQLAAVAHQLWMVCAPPAEVRAQLIERHLATGVCATRAEAVERCDGSDWVNAAYVMEHSRAPDVVVSLRGPPEADPAAGGHEPEPVV